MSGKITGDPSNTALIFKVIIMHDPQGRYNSFVCLYSVAILKNVHNFDYLINVHANNKTLLQILTLRTRHTICE